jgi:hypothetical protein
LPGKPVAQKLSLYKGPLTKTAWGGDGDPYVSPPFYLPGKETLTVLTGRGIGDVVSIR